MASNFDLERFKHPQERMYAKALSDVRSGRKQGHWIWYIFPQIEGLGISDTSRFYSIVSLEEARAYMKDPVLSERLVEISQAFLECGAESAIEVFGYLDAQKVRSSMTLFAQASDNPIFTKVIDKYYEGKPDDLTLDILTEQQATLGHA